MPDLIQIQVRQGTAALWASEDPLLLAGEPGFEVDTGKLKFGDGTLIYSQLPYINADPFTFYAIAGETLSSERALMIITGKAYHFDPTDQDNYGRMVGVSKTAAAVDVLVEYQVAGDFTYSPGVTDGALYFAGALGVPTLTAPSSGISQVIGFGISTTKIQIEIQQPINLN